MVIVSDQRMGRGASGAVPRQSYRECWTPTIPIGRCQLVVHHTLVSVSVGCPLRIAETIVQSIRPAWVRSITASLSAAHTRMGETIVSATSLLLVGILAGPFDHTGANLQAAPTIPNSGGVSSCR